jgi:hypothetical protein
VELLLNTKAQLDHQTVVYVGGAPFHPSLSIYPSLYSQMCTVLFLFPPCSETDG